MERSSLLVTSFSFSGFFSWVCPSVKYLHCCFFESCWRSSKFLQNRFYSLRSLCFTHFSYVTPLDVFKLLIVNIQAHIHVAMVSPLLVLSISAVSVM